jgi:hypothetical protein
MAKLQRGSSGGLIIIDNNLIIVYSKFFTAVYYRITVEYDITRGSKYTFFVCH